MTHPPYADLELHPAEPEPEKGTEIRATHPYGFRSGEWAHLTGVVWTKGRPCYAVRFPDGVTDTWVLNDPWDHYEFRSAPDITEVVVRDAPHWRKLTFVLLALLLAVTLGIAWSVWR